MGRRWRTTTWHHHPRHHDGYFQTWSDRWAATGSGTTLAKLPSYINVVILSFMQPGASYKAGSMSLSGTGISTSYDGSVLKQAIAALKSKNPNTRVLVAVGGATYPNFADFRASSITAFVNDFGLDGVDIDYEPSSPSCSSSGGRVSCPTDAEQVGVVKKMRAAMPRPKTLSLAAFHVGAYGEGSFASSKPITSYTGISLAPLKNASAKAALDLLNVMSYDAGPTYRPREALRAYQHYFGGKIAMGIEVPPEAWGGVTCTRSARPSRSPMT